MVLLTEKKLFVGIIRYSNSGRVFAPEWKNFNSNLTLNVSQILFFK